MVCHCWCWPWPSGFRKCLSGFFSVTIFPPCLHYCTFWKEVPMCSPDIRIWGQNLYIILLHKTFISSMPFIYLFNDFFRSVWTHEYLVYALVLTQYSFIYFVAHNIPALAFWEFFLGDSCIPWHVLIFVCICMHVHACMHAFTCACALSTYSFSGITRCSRLILHISHQVLESTISPESWFPVYENGSRNQDLHARCVICCWDVVASRSSQLTIQQTMFTYDTLHIHRCL